MTFDWNKFRGGGGDTQKWEQVGTQLTGTIVGLRTYDDKKKEKTIPLIDVDTGELDDQGEKIIKTVFVDKVDLTHKIVDASPQMGDRLRITFTGTEDGGPMKFFNVEVKSSGQKHAPAPPPEPEPPVDEFSEEPF